MQHGKYIPNLYMWTPACTHHTQKTQSLLKYFGKRIRKFYYTKFYIVTITLLEISKKFWHKLTCLTQYFPNFFLFPWTPSNFLQNTLVGHADLNNFLQCDLKNTMETDKSTVSSAVFFFLPFSKRPSLIFFKEGKLNWSDLGLICLFGSPTWIVVQSLPFLWVVGTNLMTILLFFPGIKFALKKRKRKKKKKNKFALTSFYSPRCTHGCIMIQPVSWALQMH